MKHFQTVAAQGEITIRRLGPLPKNRKLPNGYSALKPEGRHYVIGHSETSHHHVIDAAGAAVGVLDKPPAGMRVLYMILENPLALEHLRGHGRQDNDGHGLAADRLSARCPKRLAPPERDTKSLR